MKGDAVSLGQSIKVTAMGCRELKSLVMLKHVSTRPGGMERCTFLITNTLFLEPVVWGGGK